MHTPVPCFARVIAFAVGLLVAAASGLSAQEEAQNWAVVIGVSQFPNLPKQDWLEFADADAIAFQKLITSPRGRSFRPENVILLTNQDALHLAMKNKLGGGLSKRVKRGDTVYIFIATHGMVENDVAKEAYLLGYDSDREALYESALQMKDVGDIVQNRLRARQVFVMADSCRAGKLGQLQGNINKYMEDMGRQRGGLLASRPNEFSFEGRQWGGGHGAFSYFLLLGLNGEADADKDKIVTLNEITSYVRNRVAAATDNRQNVRDFGDLEGDLPLAILDKPGPPDLNLTRVAPGRRIEVSRRALLAFRLPPRPFGLGFPSSAEVPWVLPVVPDADELRLAFQSALREGRLLAPSGKNAWDIYKQLADLAPGVSFTTADLEDLKDDLVTALAGAGEKVLAAYRRGDSVVQLTAENYEGAAQQFARASELQPDEVSLHAKAKFLAGRTMVARRKFREAVALLEEAISLDSRAAHSYNALGIVQMEQAQWNEAIRNFRIASDNARKWVYPHANLGRVYTALRDYGRAEQEFKKGIQLEAELGVPYSYLHYDLALLYLNRGRAADAEEEFRRAVEKNPADAHSHYQLGLIHKERGRVRDAEISFRKAAELDARFVDARLRLAEIYRQQNRSDQEEGILRDAAAGAPENAGALSAFGAVLLRHNKLAEAERAFTQLLRLDPDSPDAFTGLGDVSAAQSRFSEAVEHYRQALARASDPRQKRELQKKLQSVEKRK